MSTEGPAWKPLNSRQRRVLGVLVEKAKTTPDVYPMTVNAIVAGCNQKSNRDPISNYDSDEVEQILQELRSLNAVTEIQGQGRALKYRHHFYEWLGIDKPESAVMCELLLRGAQTLGDLRARAARMEPIPDMNSLKPIVDLLMSKNLMIELTPGGRGQIVSHNLYKERELVELKAEFAGRPAPPPDASAEPMTSAHAPHGAATPHHVQHVHAPPPIPAAPPVPMSGYATRDMFSELEVEVAELRAEMARIREQLRSIESRIEE